LYQYGAEVTIINGHGQVILQRLLMWLNTLAIMQIVLMLQCIIELIGDEIWPHIHKYEFHENEQSGIQDKLFFFNM
jgi:hypothetical protein